MTPPFRKVALVHDWLVGQRGGEQVLLRLLHLFPDADVFALVHRPGSCHPRIEAARVRTSFVQRLPFSPSQFRAYLPLFWSAIGKLDVRAYDLVISSSHCVALGVHTHRRQTHLAYIHSPMRYLYDQLPAYLPRRAKRMSVPVARAVTKPWRWLDRTMAKRPDQLLANSQFVQERIRRVWQRDSEVVPPPVDTTFYAAAHANAPRRGLICVTALTPYKRVDALVHYASEFNEPLLVVGRGALESSLKRRAGPTVQFTHGLTREQLRAAYQRAEAFVFAGEEDAGIAPIEAMATGCPVVAFGRGGVPEAMNVAPGAMDGKGGTIFLSQDRDSIADAVRRLRQTREQGAFSAASLAACAAHYAAAKFDERIMELALRAQHRLDAR